MATTKTPAKKKKKKLPKKILRAYKGPDWYLTERSQTLCDRFALDKADYIAFDAGFDDPYDDNFQDAIDAAINYKDDSTLVAEVGEQSEEVKTQMQACRNKYTDIMYYAVKAFGKSSPILRQFGKGKKYKEASNSQGRMLNFMDELSQVANKHKVKLGTVNCTQTIIDTIATVRDGFNTINRGQNMLIDDRPEISAGRVAVNNTLYNSFTNLVSKASKSVYRTDAAKQGQYAFNPPVNPRTKPGDILLSGTVDIGEIASIEVPEYPITSGLVFIFENPGAGELTLYAAETDTEEPGATKLVLASREKQTKTKDEALAALGASDTKTLLNIKNTGDAVGHYRIIIRPNP